MATIITFSQSVAKASVGDTTIVHGFSNLLHQNCNTGRSDFQFPSDSLSFYRILLKYQLSCPSFGCDIYDRIATLKVLHPTGSMDSTVTYTYSFSVNGYIRIHYHLCSIRLIHINMIQH
ncbi:MAG: hypothetical protein IPP51_09785 [Bacteroidetes bacterium]|nr:hypothetical protein [Bacteroidota bacterium]